LFFTMRNLYGIEKIYGIRHGFSGMLCPDEWVELDEDMVQDIHNEGGTILMNQRTPSLPCIEMAQALKDNNVRQLFVLGGDGTHDGIARLLNGVIQIGLECSVIGVPSTVDSDIPMVDSTFGFDTACTEARNAIDCAYVEATCNANAIGLVKLAGTSCGYLALHTTLASRHVDLCLLPEMDMDVDKVLDQCEHLMATKGYAVVVCAHGSGISMMEQLGENSKDVDVGPWLKDKLTARFKSKNKPLTIKYIDPTHMVRTVRANSQDSIYCAALAEHAVHAGMAGFTGITCAKIYERYVYLPIQAITKAKAKLVNPHGRWFARMTFTTGQGDFHPEGAAPRSKGHRDGSDLAKLSTPVPLMDCIQKGTEIHRLGCMHLSEKFSKDKSFESPLKGTRLGLGDGAFVKDGAFSTQTFQRRDSRDDKSRTYLQFLRSGPREFLYFDPKDETAAAAIVTCGGLCPGLNSVIREVVKMLDAYGVKTIYGIKGGYKGCVEDDKWIRLTPETVQDIHMQGGSILVSDRGNPPHAEIAKTLKKRNVKQYFVLGGDGTHAGAMETFEACADINYEIAVCGVPKTIDNDITLLDKSFGFDTAVTEAEKAIDCAYCEATTNANCIGFVKLMGRSCGWVAAVATLAARHVDICLIPEMNISLPKLLEYITLVLQKKKYCVIVVAEGCGDTIVQSDADGAVDGGGHKAMADVGQFMKDEITQHCKKKSVPVTIKYIDPTYMVRSVKANASDSAYCSLLAQEAVHGAMAGFTGITVGKVDERFVMLPIHAIVRKGSRTVDPNGRTFERLMATTKQPNFDPEAPDSPKA